MASNTQTTGDKKDILLRRTKDGLFFETYFEGGGELPAALSGMYTDAYTAQKAIDKYINQRDNPPKPEIERKATGKPVKV